MCFVRFDLLRIALLWNLLHFLTFLAFPRSAHVTATPLGQYLLTFLALVHFLVDHLLAQTAGGGDGGSGDGGGTGGGGAAGAPGGGVGGGLGEGHGDPQQSLATRAMPEATALAGILVLKMGERHCVESLDGMALRQSIKTVLHEALGSAAQHESCAWQHVSTEPVGVTEFANSQTDSDVKAPLHQPGPQ